ncbi:MAG: cysteine desulfurase [Acidimicrobiaceae bacterium]|nr:cysteine desulfurase [Acidimicrobiaceae bacterium]MCS5673613.1 cysteine desulfurase [Acidimicrobiales bacterium]MEE2805606.1 cysteine desulfurase family protein [Actinomycetota bacterium]
MKSPNLDQLAYLDCAASTPVRPAVLDAMMPYLTNQFGNPSGSHRLARSSRRAIDEAREVCAALLDFDPHGIVFTSGGTESDNLAIHGACGSSGVAACPATEHHAVLYPVESHSGRIIKVTPEGDVDLEHLEAVLDDDVSVLSVMLVNNESGRVVDLEPIADVRDRRAPQALLHTDAVQAVNWVDIAKAASRADLMSLSGHKFGAPKGVGVLATRPHVDLTAQLLGGGQEAERRSGTHNTAGIVALGAALQALDESRTDEIQRLGLLCNRLAEGLVAAVPGCHETISKSRRAAGLLQLLIEDVASEALLVLLERFDLMASAAASCASGAMDPSHVLAAMGVDRVAAAGSLRLSLGWCTEEWEIDRALEVIPKCVEQVRGSA